MSISRREVLGGAATFGLVGLSAEAAAPAPGPVIAKAAELAVGAVVPFGYPDSASPAVLLRLAAPVEGGAGPGRDLVAYSAVCTHLGCPVKVQEGRMICPCHGSMFDPAAGGRCYQGPAPTALPRIRLVVDGDGAVRPAGVDGVIWGRPVVGGAL